MTRQLIDGVAVFDGEVLRADHVMVVEDGRVAGISPRGEAPAGDVLALDGGVVAPGFIDLQVNGGGGIMLNDKPGLDGLEAVCAAHERLGTTGLLPTLITDRPEVTRVVVEAGFAAAERGLAGFLGLHLEGPHLDPMRKGAHDPGLIRPMGDDDCAMLCEAARRLPALLVTVAPESVKPEQIQRLADAGAVVSLGHSDTGLAGARGAFAAGAGCVTHLFNAMSPLSHREPGLVGAALDREVYAGLIADGVHVAPEVIGVALRAKRGEDRVFLVTDAMAVAGTEKTEFTLNGRRILRSDGRLTLDDGTLAGADIDMAGSIRVLVNDVGLPLSQALRMATSIPAACIGMAEATGCLKPGVAADFVHLDADLRLRGVWRGGERLH